MNTIIHLGVWINKQDIDGRTALHMAASNDKIQAAKLLANEGIDLTIVDSRGNDAVTQAINFDHQEIHEYIDSIMTESIII